MTLRRFHYRSLGVTFLQVAWSLVSHTSQVNRSGILVLTFPPDVMKRLSGLEYSYGRAGEVQEARGKKHVSKSSQQEHTVVVR